MKNAIFLPPPALLRRTRHFFDRSRLWLLLLVVALLAWLPQASAQTGQRISIHTLSGTEQEALAELINDWLDENPNIPIEHKNCFEEGIHSTNNFLPWHRVHIQQLEDYIREHADSLDFTAHIPNINDESFRLPYWRPEEVPSIGQKIPMAFQVTFDPINYPVNTPQDTMNFDPDPADFPIMGQFLYRLSNCINLADAGLFSNALEGQYHDNGHTIVGGRMNEGDAPACLVFWLWHAWIDDLWYSWENHCQGEYDWPFNPGNDTITQIFTEINGKVTWSGELFVKGDILIGDNDTLHIQPNALGTIIHFRESRYNGFPTLIIVEPGGTLIVDGATLTGIDEFGDCGDGDDPNNGCNGTGEGSKYYTAWEGIVVQGSPGNQGWVQLLNNATIEHAITGIRSENGGQIYASNANFYNNRIDVEIGPHNGYQYASFFYCDFLNDQPLRDIVWTGGPLNAVDNCPGGTPEHHINHEDTHSTEAHIVLKSVRSPSFHGCTIDNTFQDPHGNYMSRGIVATNSLYYVTLCNIKNQVIGISGRNTVPGPGNHVRVRYSTFDNNFEGISLFGVDNSVIDYTNIFIVPDVIPTGVAPDSLLSLDSTLAFGIYTEGASGLTVADNGFSTVGTAATSLNNYGAILSNTGGGASVEKRNHFNGVGIGSQAQGGNGNLQIRCNDYNAFQFGIAVTSGLLPTQGQCPFIPNSTHPAGNLWDNLNICNPDDESQIFLKDGATPFVYWAHSDRKPTCYSDPVDVQECPTSSTTASCDDPTIPCTRCEESRIASLETQKNTLPPGDEQIQFITHEQQSIYQQGVNERLENESEGVDVAITFTQNVEAITSLWPGNKAALLLLKSEQQGTIASGTATAIAAISESDMSKKWFSLRYDLLTSGRTYSQLSSTEKTMVEAEAQQETKSGAHAKVILEIAYGVPARPNIEPINFERSSKPTKAAKTASRLSIAPNPTQELTQISFTAPEVQHKSWLTVSDLNGRVYHQIDLAGIFGEAQIPLSIADLPAGVYLRGLHLEGQPAEVKKLTIIH